MFFIIASVFVAVLTARAEDSASPLEACSDSSFFDGEAEEGEVFEVSLLQTHLSLSKASGDSAAKTLPHTASGNIMHTKEHQTASAHQHRKDKHGAEEVPLQKQPESADAMYGSENLKADLKEDESVARDQAAESRIRALLGIAFDDAHAVEQTHKILLVVICCMGLTVMIAAHYHTTHKASNKLADCLTNMRGCDQHTWHLALGPSACFKVPLEYKLSPDDCPHEEGLRTYKARHNTFQICDQCGSRWMFQKEKGAYTPIAPRAHPADTE